MPNWMRYLIVAGVAFGLGAGVGVAGYLWATGGNSEPSQDIDEAAQRLSLDDPTPTPGLEFQVATELAGINSQINALSTQVADESNGSEAPQIVITVVPPTVIVEGAIAQAPTESAPTEAPPTPTIPPTATPEPMPEVTEEVATTEGDGLTGRTLFRIDDEQSIARFFIDEELSGNPITVEGTTRQVGGDVIVDFSNPPGSQIGEIVINARTLRTDNEFRDQAIRGRILRTNDNEFIRFAPTGLDGLPTEPVNAGDTLEFNIIGDLTVAGVTREVVFTTSVTIDEAGQISGLASAEILYSAFGITINAPPNVGNISDEVILEIEFIATQVDE